MTQSERFSGKYRKRLRQVYYMVKLENSIGTIRTVRRANGIRYYACAPAKDFVLSYLDQKTGGIANGKAGK